MIGVDQVNMDALADLLVDMATALEKVDSKAGTEVHNELIGRALLAAPIVRHLVVAPTSALDREEALARARELLGQEVDVTIRVSGFAAHLDDEALALVGPGASARRLLFTDLRRGVEMLAIEPLIPPTSDEAAAAAEPSGEEVTE
jgi:hypothetical protein